MRIISGKYKGFVIRPDAKIPARPTTDRSKEAVFNILEVGYGIEDMEVLDLFSGTGNVAFEFASRGAAQVYSVDMNYHAVSFIKKTFKELDFPNATVIKDNAFRYLKNCDRTFDIIFADPPYNLGNLRELEATVFERNLLNEDGLLVIEHISRVDLDTPRLTDKRIYGQSAFSFYQKKT